MECRKPNRETPNYQKNKKFITLKKVKEDWCAIGWMTVIFDKIGCQWCRIWDYCCQLLKEEEKRDKWDSKFKAEFESERDKDKSNRGVWAWERQMTVRVT